MISTNTINKKIFDFTCSSEIIAEQMQQEFVHYTSPDLDKIINEVVTGELDNYENLIIEKIEIDLGNVSIKDFGSDEMLGNFTQFLKEKITQIHNKSDLNKDGRILSFTDAALQVTKAFLLHGSFPWWMNTGTTENLDQILKKVIDQKPADLKAFLLSNSSNQAVITRLTEHVTPSVRSALSILVPGLIDQRDKKQIFKMPENRVNIKDFSISILKKLSSVLNRKDIFYKEYKSLKLIKLIRRPYFKWENELRNLDILSSTQLENLHHFLYKNGKKYKNKKKEIIDSLSKLSVFQIEFLLNTDSASNEQEFGLLDKISSNTNQNEVLKNGDKKINSTDYKTNVLNENSLVIVAETILVNGKPFLPEKTKEIKNIITKTEEIFIELGTNDSVIDKKNYSNQNNNVEKKSFVNESSTLQNSEEYKSSDKEKSISYRKHNINESANNDEIKQNKGNINDAFANKSSPLKTIAKSNRTQKFKIISDNDAIKSSEYKNQSNPEEKKISKASAIESVNIFSKNKNQVIFKSNKVNNATVDQPVNSFFNNRGQTNQNNSNTENSTNTKVNNTNINQYIIRNSNNEHQLNANSNNNSSNVNNADTNQHIIYSSDNEYQLNQSNNKKVDITSENKSQPKQNKNDITNPFVDKQIDNFSETKSQITQDEDKINMTSTIKSINLSRNNESLENQANDRADNISVNQLLVLQSEISVSDNREVSNISKDTFHNNDEYLSKPGKNKKNSPYNDKGKHRTLKKEILVKKIFINEITDERNLEDKGNSDINSGNVKIEQSKLNEAVEEPIALIKSYISNTEMKKNNNNDFKTNSRISYIQKKIGKFNQVSKNELNIVSEHNLLQLEIRFKQFELILQKRKKILNTIVTHPYLFTYNLLELFASSHFVTSVHSSDSKGIINPKETKHVRSSTLIKMMQSAQSGLIDTINKLPEDEAVVLQDVLNKKSFETENEKKIVYGVFKKMPEATVGLLHFFTQLTKEEMKGFLSSCTKEPNSGNKQKFHNTNQDYYYDKPEKIHIENAGLCLIATYFLPLFNNLLYLENRIFKNKAIAIRALFLIQYIATGKSKRPEYLLQFNKLLCGFNVEENIAANMRLTKKEKSEADDLLGSVIENWETIKNTSLNGFRESFLQRKGILVENEFSWTLQVERKGHDMLLSTIPWGFGIIKLPWMQKHIQVEW